MWGFSPHLPRLKNFSGSAPNTSHRAHGSAFLPNIYLLPSFWSIHTKWILNMQGHCLPSCHGPSPRCDGLWSATVSTALSTRSGPSSGPVVLVSCPQYRDCHHRCGPPPRSVVLVLSYTAPRLSSPMAVHQPPFLNASFVAYIFSFHTSIHLLLPPVITEP